MLKLSRFVGYMLILDNVIISDDNENIKSACEVTTRYVNHRKDGEK